jgi:hypothetical protein
MAVAEKARSEPKALNADNRATLFFPDHQFKPSNTQTLLLEGPMSWQRKRHCSAAACETV